MSGFTILLLADDFLLYRRLVGVMEHQGWQVLRMGSGENLEEALQTWQFDLILAQMDSNRRGILKILREAKKLRPPIRLILLSAAQDMTFPLEAYELDADDYIFLPCRPAEIRRRITAGLQILPEKTSRLTAKPRLSPMYRTLLEKFRRIFHFTHYNLDSSATALQLFLDAPESKLDEKLRAKIFEVSARLEVLQEIMEGFLRGFSRVEAIGCLTPDKRHERLSISAVDIR